MPLAGSIRCLVLRQEVNKWNTLLKSFQFTHNNLNYFLLNVNASIIDYLNGCRSTFCCLSHWSFRVIAPGQSISRLCKMHIQATLNKTHPLLHFESGLLWLIMRINQKEKSVHESVVRKGDWLAVCCEGFRFRTVTENYFHCFFFFPIKINCWVSKISENSENVSSKMPRIQNNFLTLFEWATFQNKKTFRVQWYKTETSRKSSDWRNWNQRIFGTGSLAK